MAVVDAPGVCSTSLQQLNVSLLLAKLCSDWALIWFGRGHMMLPE